MMKVFLLGSFRVTLPDGGTIRFSAQSAAAIMALIALRPGRRVKRDTLAQTLWPDSPSARAAANLRQALLRLKQSLGAASDSLLIEREEIGLPDAALLWTDLDEYRSTGDPAALQATLLEGWDDEWVYREREQFQAEASRRLRELAEAALTRGQPATALRHAEALIAQEPLREEGHRLIMAAHLALGQPAAALQQYRACRTLLAQELSIEPAMALQELAHQARTAARPLSLPPLMHAPQASPFLVGRRTPLDALLQLIVAPGAGGPDQALIVGEPGIGKSRLVQEMAAGAVQAACRVLTVACHDGPAPPPHQLAAELLRAMGLDTLRRLSAAQRTTLAMILPELGQPVHTTPGDDRLRLLSVMADLFRQQVGRDPLVVVLEDIHWSDPASIRLLESLWPLLEGYPIRLAATCRLDALAERVDVAEFAARQESVGRLLRLDLAPLDAAETAQLTEVIAPGFSPHYTGWLHAETNGNPLFIIELIGATRHEPAAPPPQLPSGILRVLRWRLRGLTEQAQELLRAGAVLGQAFTADQLRAMTEWDEEELLTELDDLLLRGLLVEQGAGLRFYHARFRDVVLSAISRARLQSLHRRAARAAADDAAAAYHAELGGDWELAAEKLCATASRAFASGAHVEALDLFNRAVAVAEQAAHRKDDLLAAALRGREILLTGLGRHAERTADIDRMEQLAEANSNQALGAYAAGRRALRLDEQLQFGAAEREGKRAVLLASQAGVGIEELAGAHLGLAHHYRRRGRSRQAMAQAQEALRIARERGSLLWEGRALLELAHNQMNRIQLDATAASAQAVMELGQRLNDMDLWSRGSLFLANCLHFRGQPDQSAALFAERVAVAARHGCKTVEVTVMGTLAHMLRWQGRRAEADQVTHRLAAIAAQTEWPHILVVAERELAWTCIRDGRYDEAFSHAERLRALTAEVPATMPVADRIYLWARTSLATGRVESAQQWAKEQHPRQAGRHPMNSLGITMLVAEIAEAAGDHATARRWARWLRRWRRYWERCHIYSHRDEALAVEQRILEPALVK